MSDDGIRTGCLASNMTLVSKLCLANLTQTSKKYEVSISRKQKPTISRKNCKSTGFIIMQTSGS